MREILVSRKGAKLAKETGTINSDLKRFMKKVIHWSLVILICIFSLFSLYVNILLIFGSGFVFANIDYTEAEMDIAQQKANFLSALAFVGACVSIFMLFLSNRIAKLIVKFFGKDIEQN